VVWEITIFPDQASQCAPRDVLPMLDPQALRVDRVIQQKALPSVAQRQAPPAGGDLVCPTQPREASTLRQMPFGVALSSRPLRRNISESRFQITLTINSPFDPNVGHKPRCHARLRHNQCKTMRIDNEVRLYTPESECHNSCYDQRRRQSGDEGGLLIGIAHFGGLCCCCLMQANLSLRTPG
jgi:hypothetical protein